MSSEIRAGDEKTYWVISNGLGFVDGATDPGLITTVGDGWYLYWIGINIEEYKQICSSINITARNSSENIPTTDQNIPTAMSLINDFNKKIESLDSLTSEIENKQQDTMAKLDTLGFVVPGSRISARQARLWLIQNGVDLNSIETAIDSIEDDVIRASVRVEWEYATYVERSYPWLSALASKLGFSEEDLDRAFQEAPFI